LEKLNLNNDESLPNQLDKEAWPEMKTMFQSIFASKTQQEWCLIFDGSDACVTPVLSFKDPIPNTNRMAEAPSPAPQLSRTPAKKLEVVDEESSPPFLNVGENSVEILKEFGIESDRIKELLSSSALVDSSSKSKL
jgi:alpha-methylacyl-CoA racemase